MKNKTNVYVAHTSHLDLYWVGAQADCLEKGAKIIDSAVELAAADKDVYFLIETIRFIEYYLDRYPDKKETLKKLIIDSQIEVAACYTDRLENHIDGESLIRNVLYGKKMLKKLLGIDTEIACHPDLPGFAEQSPQIYKKSGVNYYLSARGHRMGARFLWKGLDNSKIIMYNFPINYCYYSVEDDVIPIVDVIKKNIKSDDILICCSAGDLVLAGFFSKILHGKYSKLVLADAIKEWNEKYPELNFKVAPILKVLKSMDEANLEIDSGENPSRWGHTGSALNVKMYLLDKLVSSVLLEAEKFSTVCDLLGMPVTIDGVKHPLRNRGYSQSGSRRYFDLEMLPSGTEEWLEFAWRLQIITHDHNQGGVDGAQTNFDKFRYKEAALQIAELIRQESFRRLCACISNGENSLTVFNSLSWPRSELVCFASDKLDKNKNYVAVDGQNNRYPVMNSGNSYEFFASKVPSFGYKSYRLEEGVVQASGYREAIEKDNLIVLKNAYYELVIDRNDGTLQRLTDLENGADLTGNGEFLGIKAYEDNSMGVSEKKVDKKLLDDSRKHVVKAGIVEDNAFRTRIMIVTEIFKARATIEIILLHYRKELQFKPSVYWPGSPDLQLKMNLGLAPGFEDIYYGVPYGVQKFGNYLEKTAYYSDDEISSELYKRYREVQYWIAAENGQMGVCISSNHSAYDFTKEGITTMLARDVRNGGDEDVRFSNEGELSWTFCLSSYNGSWQANDAYKKSWELIYPMQVKADAVFDAAAGINLPLETSFIETGSNTILSVLKKSECPEGGYLARVFNCTPGNNHFKFNSNLGLKITSICDFNENSIAGEPDIMEPFEIRAVKLEKVPSI